jgi:hypothetical protein
LTDACWNTYASTATKIGPEVFAFVSADGGYTGNDPATPEQDLFYLQHGYYITAADYILRPEVLESNFYAWRVTGDTKYLDRAASAIQSFEKYIRTSDSFAGIDDVDDVDSEKIDDMESFWFAEVLKYLWLTFDDPNHISLDECMSTVIMRSNFPTYPNQMSSTPRLIRSKCPPPRPLPRTLNPKLRRSHSRCTPDRFLKSALVHSSRCRSNPQILWPTLLKGSLELSSAMETASEGWGWA